MSAGDLIGVALSAICILHCLAAPLALAVFPFIGLLVLDGDAEVHRAVACAVAVPVLLSIVPGYLVHRRLRIAGTAAVGVSMVCFAAFVPLHGTAAGDETVLTIGGGALLVSAHLNNWRAVVASRAQGLFPNF
ncbi:MAG: MerC domain-containing protein [Burkholderiales bacterium]